ncbi:MAG TPA: hypothetical protein VGD62_01915, partial [Acidobacteriaceae bacterium]
MSRILCLTATAALAMLAPVGLQAQNSAPASDAYQGVSHPPADDTIQASPDPATVPSHAKPSAGVPAAQPAYAGAQPTPSAPALSATDDPKNPDYGIVTSVNGQRAEPVDVSPSRPTHLIARPENPDNDIVGVIPSSANQLAEGTGIRVRLMQNLSTGSTQDGTPFRGQVAADVYKDGRVVIPMGSELRGHVMSVSQGHRIGAPATLRLRPEVVMLPDGTSYH